VPTDIAFIFWHEPVLILRLMSVFFKTKNEDLPLASGQDQQYHELCIKWEDDPERGA